MFNVRDVDEVLEIIDENFAGFPLGKEKVKLASASGRVTAEAVLSREDVPGFNRSSVDGYAVIARDTNGASESLPAQLELVGEVKMGEKPEFDIARGQAAYVPTGGEVPAGADAVVMIEYAENLEDGFIYIEKPAAPGNNMVFAGDDAKRGSTVIQAGHRLRPQDIGALAAMGYPEVAVKRLVKVGILSTGDELVGIEEEVAGAKVRDVNSHFLYSELIRYGAEPVPYGIIKDGYERVRDAVSKAVEECDLVLVSGGSSVGQKDETYRVIHSLEGCEILLHGIAVKPGKPTIMAKVKGKAVVGLPGHPVSAYFIYRVVVRRLLDAMYGVTQAREPYLVAEMACNYPSNEGREEYLPVKLETVPGKTLANPVFGKSGLITLLAAADGYVRIGRGVEGLAAGQRVEVIPF
ncbi:MAG: molybdopterin molybdotransferase MoeA [Clostridiales bacterium]|jgi:molybdopterin molybdotransferase|nr:molybdopterin molybdotransferase MoeA [Eubacteriales bacterium]MDH7566473.1 molybdopterin molybdotransferase MoeA [Clostridiales bacterium]